MSFKKILVAIDRSAMASVVFEQALELAQKDQARLMIYHSPNREDWGESWPLVQTGIGVYPVMAEELYQLQEERLQQEIKRAQTWLQTYCQQAMAQGIPVEFDCQVQSPGGRICELARTWGADLIVLGRRGRSGLAEMVLGSVSNHVIHHAVCSVLVTQGGNEVMDKSAGKSTAAVPTPTDAP